MTKEKLTFNIKYQHTNYSAVQYNFWIKIAALLLGPLACTAILLMPVPSGLNPEAWKVIACATWMILWWLTEIVPIPVTSLLPLVAFPLLGISGVQEAAAPYSNPNVFLFMGGFMIAAAMERWQLHLRIALHIIRLVGSSADRIILGFMLSSCLISMWISNTATTVMMLPIALAMIDLLLEDAKDGTTPKEYLRFFTALMLGVAYAANIGGLATLVGTPPNIIFAGFIRETYHININFASWAMIGVPLALILLFLAWILLTKLIFRSHLGELHGSHDVVVKELRALGPMRREEKCVMFVFLLTAVLWMTSPWLSHWFPIKEFTEPSIAIFSTILMFIIPTDVKKGQFILDWQTAVKIPWGILLLFGGGLSLANALANTGVIVWIGHELASLHGMGIMMVITLTITVVMIMTEFMSNMALTTIFLPVATALAISLGENPLLLAIPVTLASSAAFMFPMSTPPNAIVFASGHVTIPRMMKAGFFLNVISLVLIMLFIRSIIPYAFDIKMGTLPEWVTPSH